MSRGHKVLDTWFKNRQAQQNAQIPTPAERKAALEKQQNKKIKVDETTDLTAGKEDTMNQAKKGKRLIDLTKDVKKDKDPECSCNEAIDKEHPIYKEYQSLKQHDIKSLRDIIKRQHRIVDTSEFRTKEHAISHILHNRHGSKRMAMVFGEAVEIAEQGPGKVSTHNYTMAAKKTPKVSKTVADAKDTNHRQMNNLVHGREGGVHASQKTFREENDMFKHAIGSLVICNKTQRVGSVQAAEGDQYTVVYADGSTETGPANYWTPANGVSEAISIDQKKQRLRDALDRHTEKALAANKAGDDEATKVHQGYMNKIKGQMAKLARNESVEDVYDTTLDEAWNVNNRNPQRGIKVGHKVRSYDFPGMHDSHYIEGHVVGETPSSYHIKVNRVVRDNKEIPTPAHMSHVEAPKGKSLWTDAYAVHKIMSKQQDVQAPVEAPKGGAKTFSKAFGSRLKKGTKV